MAGAPPQGFNIPVPPVDSLVNSLINEAVGNKQDAAVAVVGLTASEIAYLKGILNVVNSIAGGTYWNVFGPGNVQVTNAVTLGVSVFDPGGGIIPQADITAGTYQIDQIRLGVLTNIVAPGTASSKMDGAVYVNYAFPAISWAIGDLFVATFTGISVSIGGIVTNFPPIQVWGRVVTEPDIKSTVDTINTNQGNPAADTLISTTAKLGNLARTLKLLLGARWDAAGDLGTDIAALLGAEIPLSGTVVDGAPAVGTFKTSLAGANNQYNGGLLLFSPGAANAGQSHLIDIFMALNGAVTFVPSDQWTAVPVNGDAFVVIPNAGVYLKKIFAAVGLGALAATALTNATWTDALATALASYTAAKAAFLDIAISSREASGAAAAALAAVTYTMQAGVMQSKAITADVQRAAGTYDLFTGTAQDVLIDSLTIRMSGGAAGGTVTSISIQTNDATPQTFISALEGAIGNLLNQAQLSWAPAGGKILLKVGQKIQLTIAGGAAGAANLADVAVDYHAVVSGGYLV